MQALYWVILVIAIVSAVVATVGGVLLFKKMQYDKNATATVTKVACQERTNKCNITLQFNDKDDNEITGTAIVTGPVAEGSTRKIMYDSSNPNSFYPSQPPVRLIGASMFGGGIALLVICIGVAVFAYFRQQSPAAPPAPTSSQVRPAPSLVAPSPLSPAAATASSAPPLNPTPRDLSPQMPSKSSKSPFSFSPAEDTKATVMAKEYGSRMVENLTRDFRRP